MSEVNKIKQLAHELAAEAEKLEVLRSELISIGQFGEFFSRSRKDRGMTIEEVAALSGISSKTISLIENRRKEVGSYKIGTLSKLADVVGMELCIKR